MTIGILNQAWSGSLELQDTDEMSAIARVLSSLLAAPLVCFVSDMFDAKVAPGAWVAGEEIYPGASLADVLYEEYGVEVTDESIVYVEPRRMRDMDVFSSVAVRQAIGDVLAGLAKPNALSVPDSKDASDGVVPLKSVLGGARRPVHVLIQ